MKTLNIPRIRRLVQSGCIDTIAKETGVSKRTLFRIKSDQPDSLPSLATLQKLAEWAKGKR